MKTEDTISAIATALGTAGVGIIRMSGENSIAIAEKIFDRPLQTAPDRKIIFGHIKNPAGEIVDEVLILIMRAPKSYTRENVVEIQCHGGVEVLREILSLTFKAGARPAERGEFTKRAFLNGRLDLSQAQAVLDVIQAKTATALSVAQNQLAGKTSKKIRAIRTEILNVLAHIEALIDFPEDDIDDAVTSELDAKILAQIDAVKIFLANQRSGRILREGLETAIIGKPNVGKSSLLNFLAETDRAIVTDIPGTTRDSIEEFVNIRGVPLKIIDTAGIRSSDNPVEQIGIERAKDCAGRAELILALFDSSREISAEDLEILRLIEGRSAIILLTKADLTQVIDTARFENFIAISVKTGAGVEKFLDTIAEKAGAVNAEMNFVRDEREADLLRRAVENLEEARATLSKNIGIDFVAIDLRAALELLSELTGESVTEDVINEIFSKFCIGK
ncbi:MAG: tRNA uridine-5-carboxymethylaminomethyl(34) synthesis GTPase MnmE [Selenomonadaceae bacterium]|nr:tRNA uridine-5-carboxymethylaminomethyl(34) synthesis GTPase MnmE [Selenomonadaceae bacterium]